MSTPLSEEFQVADQTSSPLSGLERQISQLQDIGSRFYQRGWSVGTSSNYSLVTDRDPLELLVTASGKDKGQLQPHEFVRVDATGSAIISGQPKASAETLLHVTVAEELENVGCILHTHSVWATELSDHFFGQGGILLEGYEMLKGLAGIKTHEHPFWFQIFENTQDIPQLAAQLRARLRESENPLTHGYLIRRHGLYTWGSDVAEARRHVEILEFLLECVGRRETLRVES